MIYSNKLSNKRKMRIIERAKVSLVLLSFYRKEVTRIT